MMVDSILQALALLGGIGVSVGIVLAAASKIFYVYVDPKILAVEDILPGANCGGCGLPGCSANAEAIVAGIAAPNSCVAAGPEVAEAIAEIQATLSGGDGRPLDERYRAPAAEPAAPRTSFGPALASTVVIADSEKPIIGNSTSATCSTAHAPAA